MKKLRLFSIALAFILLVISLTGCQSFSECNVGDEFGGNRDGYKVKLNSCFFADVPYDDAEKIEIYKLNDINSDDLIGSSELYFTGDFEKCYSNEDNILIESSDDYILIDCNDIDNQISSPTVDNLNIDLSAYTEINFYMIMTDN